MSFSWCSVTSLGVQLREPCHVDMECTLVSLECISMRTYIRLLPRRRKSDTGRLSRLLLQQSNLGPD